ncbi:MAG: DNA translocase FtsK [Bacteroidota bacterium]|nr:DNA translocase FtsK [Bacteroidota bacterium]
MSQAANVSRNEVKERNVPEKRDTKSSKGSKFELSPRAKTITGLFLISFSIFLTLAFVSFMATWEADQSSINALDTDMLQSARPEYAENWMGLLGAYAAHLFIYEWFGIASFLFLPLLFLLGYRVLFNPKDLPLSRILGLCVFGILFISVFSGFAFQWSYDYLGGAVGYHTRVWLAGLIGSIGVGMLLALTFICFLVVMFNFQLKWPVKAATETGMPQEEHHIDVQMQNEDNEFNEDEMHVIVKSDDKETVKPILHATQTVELKTASGLDLKIKQPITEDYPVTNEKPLIDESVNTESWYKFPPLTLLKAHEKDNTTVSNEELEESKSLIEKTLQDYKIGIRQIEATIGPSVTLYEIVPDAGIRISKIKNLEDDIALSLSALGIRIIAPIPGKGTIGIEVPNRNPQVVSLKQALSSEEFRKSTYDLPIALGKTISNQVFVADLTKMPHLLMAGATGQGKSVGINTILASILYKKHPDDVKFVLIDPKKVELSLYKLIEKHFLPELPDGQEAIITDTRMVVDVLKSLCYEMDSRYDKLKDAQVRNIKEYNKKIERGQLDSSEHTRLPYIVLVIDELADLMMTAGKEVELPIARLAQLARAIGIHLIVATQRPSVNIITGIIKANFPSRIAFRVTAKVDSRTIMDSGGAEQLIGRGDMLYSTGNDVLRLQCPFIDTEEVELLAQYISEQPYPEPFRLKIITDEDGADSMGSDFGEDLDSMFEDAARLIVGTQQGSTSLLQRRLKLGYNRAGRLMDQLEKARIVGGSRGSSPREVLVSDEVALEQFLTDLVSKSK